jgi:hypothetical protein
MNIPITVGAAEKNLAYNDDYVWQLAWRLSTMYGMRHAFSQLPPENSAQFSFEIALDYHHRMIACDGPLPKIAPYLVYARTSGSFEEGLQAIASSDRDVWPVILDWALSLENQVTKTFKAGKVSTNFPSCLVPGYVMPKITD